MFRTTAILGVAVAALALCAPFEAAQAQWKPTKHVELIVGADAAGVQDRLTRLMQQIIEKDKLIPTTISTVNKPGAAQLTAIAYMNSHRADPHYLVLVASAWQNNAIINNDMAALSDVVPIMSLYSSTSVYWTAANNQLKTGKDIVERLKKDPGSVSFSMSAPPGSQNWLTVVQFFKAAGQDPRKMRVAINSTGAETSTQVLGGHSDVGVGGLDTALPLQDGGKARVLGVLKGTRLTDPRAASLPTMAEQGVNAISNNWYAIVGPKGMPAEAGAYWEDVLKKAANSEEAKKFAVEAFWNPELVGMKDFQAYLTKNEQEQRVVLNELGLIKK